MSSTNNLNNTDSEATASETLGQDSNKTKKCQRLTKTVPELWPLLEKLIEHVHEYSKKVTKESAKKNLDLPRLKRHLKSGQEVMAILQNAISRLETRIDSEQLLLNSPGFQHISNDVVQMGCLIGTSHQNSSELPNKSI